MKNYLILLFVIFTSNLIEAQFIKEKSMNAQIGYAMSVPYRSFEEIGNSGLFSLKSSAFFRLPSLEKEGNEFHLWKKGEFDS